MANSRVCLIVLLLSLASASDTCLALVMEGGGTHGAYEAGVLYSLTHNLPASEVAWNVISGISTGSLNAGQCAQFAYGDEQAMAQHLIDTWTMIQNQSMIAPPWPGSTFHSLFHRPSLYTTEPLRQFLTSRMGSTVLRNVTVGTTNLVNGVFTDFTEAMGIPDLVTATMCYAAPPVAFPPIQFQGSWYIDGGVTINQDGYEAIKRCRQQGFALPDITLDMIFDYHALKLDAMVVNTTQEVMSRVNDIQNYYNLHWYVQQIYESYPEINFRYAIFPSVHLPPLNGPPGPPLDFSPADMEIEISLGKQDGLNAVFGPASGLKGLKNHVFMEKRKVHYF